MGNTIVLYFVLFKQVDVCCIKWLYCQYNCIVHCIGQYCIVICIGKYYCNVIHCIVQAGWHVFWILYNLDIVSFGYCIMGNTMYCIVYCIVQAGWRVLHQMAACQTLPASTSTDPTPHLLIIIIVVVIIIIISIAIIIIIIIKITILMITRAIVLFWFTISPLSTCSIAQSANSTKHTSKKQNSLRNLLSCPRVLRMLSVWTLRLLFSIVRNVISVSKATNLQDCSLRGNGWYITTFTHGSFGQSFTGFRI